MHVQTQAQAPSEQPDRIRLICLACSRQQLLQYQLWAEALGEPVELVAVDLPPTACLEAFDRDHPPGALAALLAEQLQPYLAGPHALFGQSLGAHVALALTQLAQRAWPGQTLHLFVAGCDSPDFAAGSSSTAIQVPMTVLYPPGALPAMLGWNRLARRGLELIELPVHSVDSSLFDQRIVRIFSTHLGPLSF